LIAADIPRSCLVRVVYGAGILPAGAMAERYGSSVIWSLGSKSGTRQVGRLDGVTFAIDRDYQKLKAGVYRIKAAFAEARGRM
jgi:hypothetical protein